MFYTIKKPLVTEKNSMMAEHGVYVFEVDRNATKTEIKSSIEKYFDVRVDSVRTSICRNRARRTKLGAGKVQYWKKAMVKLKEGEKITIFEGA